jgi:hypothetical protein
MADEPTEAEASPETQTPAPESAPLAADPAPTATQVAQDPREARVRALVIGWQRASLCNSPVSRDALCWATVEAALEPLIQSILAEV